MKLGLGLGGTTITRDNMRYARQLGVTHLVLHLTDYGRDNSLLPAYAKGAAGFTGSPELWTLDDLLGMKAMAREEGLEINALENFNPYYWYDVLLDGPRKQEQIENLKILIRRVGQAGIPNFGYNFSLAGVWGLTSEPLARGGAPTASFLNPEQTPIPNGMVWNMVYDPHAAPGTLGEVTQEQLWQRLEYFLRQILPVAEEAGVTMALHPDDPPFSPLRGSARLVHQPGIYQQVFDLVPSPNSQAELCVGTVSEMSQGNVYDAVEQYSRAGKVAYVHLRNVKGKVPNYVEVFIDEGDTDTVQILRILHRNGFDGVVIPDHTPAVNSPSPWHTGMAFALGYIRAAMSIIAKE